MAESTNKSTGAAESGDLDKLLDSCLEDFDKPLPKPAVNAQSNSSVPETSSSDAGSETQTEDWKKEFEELNEIMASFMNDPSQLKDLNNLVSEFQNAAPQGEVDLQQTFADTLRELTENAQTMPDQPPEQLLKMFAGLNMEDTGSSEMGDVPGIVPLMQNLMQNLMSKELLYPSLKEITDKYPDWLAEHETSLKKEELDKYKLQYELMGQVCVKFENEDPSSDEEKKQQFESILQLMQKVQSCGNPPKELIATTTPNLPFDEDGNFKMPGAPQQCVMM